MQGITVNQVLRQARRLIAEVGWTQCLSVSKDMNGNVLGYCITGAIDHAAKQAGLGIKDDQGWEAENAVEAALGFLDGATIMDWNDSVDRTEEQVLAVFDKAIRSTRQS